MRLHTAFLWTMIVSLSLAAAMGIVTILADGLGDLGERALATSLLVGAFSLTSLACAFVLGRRRARPTMWTGIGASFLALVGWLVFIWFDAWRWSGDWDERLIKSSATVTVLAAWAALVGLLVLLVIHRASWRAVRTATLVLATLLGITIATLMWTEEFEDWTFKIFATLAILTACGTAVTPVLALIEKIQGRAEPVTLDRRVQVSLTCPRCESTIRVRAGRDKCPACNLRIGLDIDDPRCACGYLLYGLSGDQCPECGREIPEIDRWGSGAAREA
jgi:hypothetical protein